MKYTDGSAFDSSIYTFSSTTPSLTIQTSTESNTGVYNFEYAAYLDGLTTTTASITFKVTIETGCVNPTITGDSKPTD